MISTCKLEEDSISESHAITGSLAGAKAFGADNYDTLTTKGGSSRCCQAATQGGRGGSQICWYLLPFYFSVHSILHQDSKGVLECLQKSLCTTYSTTEEIVTIPLRCNTLTITLLIAAHLLSVRPQTIKVTLIFVHQVPPKFVNSLV